MPVLQLDDGTVIADIVAICAYIEELHPEPALIGATPEERAVVTALNTPDRARWLLRRDGRVPQLPTRGLKGRALPGPHDYEQIPELAERGRARVAHFFRDMDARLAGREFVAGSRYTIADITALVVVDFARPGEARSARGVRQSAPLVCGCVGKAERKGLDAALRQISRRMPFAATSLLHSPRTPRNRPSKVEMAALLTLLFLPSRRLDWRMCALSQEA